MLPTAKPANCAVANTAIPRPRTQPGSANWADTFKVAIAATQEIPANMHAIKPIAGARAMANRASASAGPDRRPCHDPIGPQLCRCRQYECAANSAGADCAEEYAVCLRAARDSFTHQERQKRPIDARERAERSGPDHGRAQIRIIASVAQTAANSVDDALGG